jgi:hypothetical protein
MESLYAKHNHASNGTTCIEAEYLEVEATRARRTKSALS